MRISDWSSDVCSSDLLDEAPARHIGPALVHHIERAARAVKFVGAALIAFAALEEGQHVSIAPPRRTERRPLVIIEGVAANIDHRVDRARPAQPAPARLVADSSEEHTSELQSLMRNSYAVFRWQQKT